MDENAAVVLVTMISGLCQMLIGAGVCKTEDEARAHLAASMLSPSTGSIGSLVPLLQGELERLQHGHPKSLSITSSYEVRPIKADPSHGQLIVYVSLNGRPHSSIVAMSGPIEDIRQFAAGEIDNAEVMRRWGMKEKTNA